MIFHQLVSVSLPSHQRLETYKARHPEDPSWMFCPCAVHVRHAHIANNGLPKVTSPHESIMGVAASTQSGWCLFLEGNDCSVSVVLTPPSNLIAHALMSLVFMFHQVYHIFTKLTLYHFHVCIYA